MNYRRRPTPTRAALMATTATALLVPAGAPSDPLRMIEASSEAVAVPQCAKVGVLANSTIAVENAIISPVGSIANIEDRGGIGESAACNPAKRRRPAYVPEDPLLSAREAAAERGQGLSTFWRDVRARRVPPAYYVSPRCPRWRRSEIRAALEACRCTRNGPK